MANVSPGGGKVGGFEEAGSSEVVYDEDYNDQWWVSRDDKDSPAKYYGIPSSWEDDALSY